MFKFLLFCYFLNKELSMSIKKISIKNYGCDERYPLIEIPDKQLEIIKKNFINYNALNFLKNSNNSYIDKLNLIKLYDININHDDILDDFNFTID